MEKDTVLVSGASGFLGRALCRDLLDRGFHVRGLGRKRDLVESVSDRIEWFHCDLPDVVDEKAFSPNIRAFVHCAYETRFKTKEQAWRVNVDGSALMFQLCESHSIGQRVFISSFSAYKEAISIYGHTKLAVENMLDLEKDTVLRPGHIIGPGGVFRRTVQMISRLPFIPLFFGGRQPVQTIAVRDVCEAVWSVINRSLGGIYRVAEIKPIELRQFYSHIAQAVGKNPVFVQIPGNTAFWALRAAESMKIRLPLSSDNLLGLKRLRSFNVYEDLKRLRINPQPLLKTFEQLDWAFMRSDKPF